MPAVTQEGKNTGGAIVNGQIWVAKIEVPDALPGGNNTNYNIDPVSGTYTLKITLRQYNNINSHISIYLFGNQDFITQSYILDNVDNNGAYNPNLQSDYITDSSNTVTLTITKFDKVNNIVSGTFSFKAVNSAGEVVTITEGRFDRKFL